MSDSQRPLRGHSPMAKLRLVLAPVAMAALTACASNAAENRVSTLSNAKPRAAPAANIEYTQIAPFVQMGGAWGDRSKGAHGTFGIFPGGARSPAHTHSGAYHGVVISGTMTNPFNGETNSPELKAGSYWYVPGGVEHVTACVSAEPCTFYFHADGSFDFQPVKRK